VIKTLTETEAGIDLRLYGVSKRQEFYMQK